MKRKILLILLTIISAVCLCIGIAACGEDESGGSGTKQVPVYQGMVISSAEITTDATTASASVNANAYSDGGYYEDYYYYYHHYRGDYEGKDKDIDSDQPFDDNTPTIEQQIETSLKVTGTGQSIYYADKKEDIYITIKLSNPDSYEILSFVLNGTKYTGYMFETGSDLENIIVKLNVGSVGGIQEYTIDEIKYVDGTEIKDVLLDGDTVVKCGVRADDQTYATISDETCGLDTISFNVKIVDLYSLIEYSGGYAMAVLYDGDSLVQTVELEVGANTVEFTNLSPNTLYQYAVIALYDDLSGTGTALNYLYKNAVYTDTIVLFNNITVGQEGITYGYSWYDGYSAATITQLTLSAGSSTQTLDSGATAITGLLSNTEYVLNAYYTNLDGDTESISLTFTTLEKSTPAVEITTLTSGQDSIDYALTITDTDGVGLLTSVTLSLGETEVETAATATGTFSGLLSNNTYTVTVVYTYDLNDGNGEQTAIVTDTITTQAKATPTVDIEQTNSDTTSLEFELTFADTDNTGLITAIGLYNGDTLVASITDFTLTTLEFTNLDSYTQYTLVVDYKYNLNDGNGVIEKSSSLSVYTDPVIEFETLSVLNTSAVSEGETIVIQAEMINSSNATFNSVVVNGETYSVSSVSTKTKLRIEIVNDGQFAGGETELVISQINYTFGNNTYSIDITQNNTVTVFINGELTVEDISVVRKNDNGEYEETYYGFYSEQLYYKITLNNATEYEVYSVTIGDTTYTSADGEITMAEDNQLVYIAITNRVTGWLDYTLSSISYSNSSFDKIKPVDLSLHCLRLLSDDIVTITSAEQLLDVNDLMYYKLANDIDLSGYEWANMGNNMNGVFDGNGYSITNMRAVTTYSDTDLYLGLFSDVYGIVTNLNITDALYMVTVNNTTGNSYNIYAGGFAAYINSEIIIDNCNVEVSIQITNNNTNGNVRIGGIAGVICTSYVTLKDIGVEEIISVTNQSDSWSLFGGIAGSIEGYQSVVLTGLDVSLTCNISAYDCDAGEYFGYYQAGGLTVANSTAEYTYTVTMTNGNIIYYGLDGFEFSYSNGVYALTEYYGSDTDIVLPDSIYGSTYAIGSCAFSGTTVESITITKGVNALNSDAFYNCSAKIIWSDDIIITEIGEFAFNGYAGTSLTISDSVVLIDNYAFANSNSLLSIVLPNSVTSIGNSVFFYCSVFNTVFYGGTESEWYSVSIGDDNDYLTSATIYYYSETQPTESGNYWYYDANGEVAVWA